MSNQMPIYSQVLPKSQFRSKGTKTRTREFDPLNFNNGGNFSSTVDKEKEKDKEREKEKKERRSNETSRSRRNQKNEASDGKVEAYLKQYQVNMRQQQNQHRHSAVRQAEHRVNLRSLPLNEVTSSRGHDRTPTDRHRGFPERERDGTREHRRERDRDRDRDRDRELEFDGIPLSPSTPRDRPVRKSSSAHRVTETAISTDQRRFFCREWAFQKIAHCLEQRPHSKTNGALVIGDAGSGKTALCQELSSPGQGPQARQQRALNRRLLARHFLQSNSESSLRPGEFVRSLAMQILSHSSRTRPARDPADARPHSHRRDSAEERSPHRRGSAGEDRGSAGEDRDSSKPLLADCEDRTDEEESVGRRTRTIERIHEREAYLDSMIPGAELAQDPLPAVLPRRCGPASPRASPPADLPLYENHENIFLRNISARSSSPRLQRQSSEPAPQRRAPLHKSHSTETNESKMDSPLKSRIPVANFRYPNKSELKSAENSPKKAERREEEREEELPEYQNVLTEEAPDSGHCVADGEGTEEVELGPPAPEETLPPALEDAPPPIPSLPVSPRTLIANLYYDKLLAHPEIQQALLPQHLERAPDECFKKALLFPLLEIEPPKHCLFLLVDGIDEGTTGAEGEGGGSASVGALLARHQHLLPQWLLLVCTTRPRPKKAVSNMFTGFRKITLDELSRAHVSADVQRYVLARLDTEPRLRARVSSDSSVAAAAAAALDHLRIKSDGCLLYLEKVLDGVADGFIALREIKEIPGTLNGLYLWLAQRLFHGKRFSKVRLLLDVLLAARCGVTEEMLYRCLLTKEYSVTRDDFNRRMHLLRRILVVSAESGHVRLFHHSFASWLVDVKHCTARYLASPSLGHGALAMYYTLTAARLSALEIHHYVFHMTQLERHLAEQRSSKNTVEGAVDLHTLTLLWILDSGCDVDAALRHDILQVESKLEDGDADPESEGKESLSGVCDLSGVMPALSVSLSRDACLARDIHVTRALTALSRQPQASALHTLLLEDPASRLSSPQPDPEELACEPSALHDIVARGDVDTLTALLKRYPQLVESCDVNGGSALHTAARSGAAACARALLAAGAAVDAADADGWTPLRAAAWAGHTDVLEVLLQHGCDVHAVDADSRTALRAAAWSGHVGVVSRLLAAGAAAESADAEGRTPLLAAAYMGHADIVRALLAAGASVHTTDHDGRSALSVAALCAQGAEVAALLVERGADVNKADRDRATPLIVAAFEGHNEICELLLEAEADVEAMDASGRTALWAAAAAGHARVVRLLLFWGACVDNMDAEGRTVLSTAAAQGNVEVVRQLLDRGLDEHHRDNSGWTPLHYAAFEGHIEVCEALLEAGAKVDEADNDGKGALLLAAQEGHTRLCECLVDTWRAPVHQHAHDGKTALRLAALEGHFDTVSALHARGADPDAPDADRRSTLYVLALDNRLAMARYLLTQCGAAVDTTDNEGRTPLHVSAWQGHTDMVNLLVKVGGAAVDARDRCMRTALHAAAWRGRGAALRALLALGADPSALCTQGATPLGIAAQEGHEECVVWLLQHGADPNKPDHAGRTPGKVAWRAGHGNICRLLERWAPAAPAPAPAPRDPAPLRPSSAGSPESKRRSVHSSSSTRSSNRTALSSNEHEHDDKVRSMQRSSPAGSPESKRRSVHSSSSTRSSNRTALSSNEHEHDDKVRSMQRSSPAGSPESKRRSVHSSSSTRSSNRTALSSNEHEHDDKVRSMQRSSPAGSPESKRRSVHSSSSTRSSNRTALSSNEHEHDDKVRSMQRSSPAGSPESKRRSVHSSSSTRSSNRTALSSNEHEHDDKVRSMQRSSPAGSPESKRRSVHSSSSTRSSNRTALSSNEHEHDDKVRSMQRSSPAGSPESKRRSVHSSSSTRSSNRTALSSNEHEHDDKSNNANLSLSFAAQVARCGRTRRERDREEAIPEDQALEKDNKLDASNRSYIAHERDRDLRACERDRRRDERHAIYEPERDNASPLYASPPHSPVSDLASPTTNCVGGPPASVAAGAAGAAGAAADTHFNRDTHMRIILGREAAPDRDSKGKRNGIVTNPAMRLVANVRNGLDNAAANIRRTGVALAASASSANPAVKSNAFQWRKETPL